MDITQWMTVIERFGFPVFFCICVMWVCYKMFVYMVQRSEKDEEQLIEERKGYREERDKTMKILQQQNENSIKVSQTISKLSDHIDSHSAGNSRENDAMFQVLRDISGKVSIIN